MMVYSDHAGGETDRHSCTGYMIFVNMALIDWLSKKQATVEKDVFGEPVNECHVDIDHIPRAGAEISLIPRVVTIYHHS